jgi:putative two-component system response regulator
VQQIAAHQRRVRRLVAALCTMLGVDPPVDIQIAAGLHDIGKLAVLDLVALPRSLSEDEFRAVQAHPIMSAAILEASGFPEAARIARSHHERWDGSGYPDGLSGTRIPLEARILSAADTLAAMIERRPYRPAADPAAELRRAAGTQLDPEIALAAALLAESMRGV